MRMLSSVSKRLALCASLASLALVLAYLEAISGIDELMPVPGTKLGLANIAVIAAAYTVSLGASAAVSFLRVIAASLLFGTPISFFYSLLGALFAYAFLALARHIFDRVLSPIGVSVGSAALHMVGQLTAASIMLGDTAVLRLLPIYLVFSVVSGVVTGCLSQLLIGALGKTQKQKI